MPKVLFRQQTFCWTLPRTTLATAAHFSVWSLSKAIAEQAQQLKVAHRFAFKRHSLRHSIEQNRISQI
jgi:hypothetical protein